MRPTTLILGVMIADEARELLETNGVRVIASEPDFADLSISEVLDQCQPDALIVRKGQVDRAALSLAPRLKVIAKHGVGVDTIDIAAATERGIPVLVTTGANALSVAEHALTLTLCALKHVTHLDRRLRAGHWDKAVHRGGELSGKQVGLIGFGRIAQHFARLLTPFNAKITALVRHPSTGTDNAFDVTSTNSLQHVLNTSDIVSLHCPLTDATRHILNENAFHAMRTGVTIINTARGGLIDEAALLRAIESGKVRAAGLDCLAQEPPMVTDRLLSHPAVITTPHIAWATHEAAQEMGLMTARNILGVLTGQTLQVAQTVNFLDLKASSLPAISDTVTASGNV